MREILFRAKREIDNKWVEGLPTRIGETLSSLKDKDGFDHVVLTKTIRQYTGLKDKNGKMIFEGDIVKEDCEVEFIVEYKKCMFGLVGLHARHYENFKALAIYIENGWKLKIIGNIHDNPELLKDGAENESK